LFQVDVLKTKLWIEFDGEVGLDYGGVARFEIMPVIVVNVILLIVSVVKSLLDKRLIKIKRNTFLNTKAFLE
jgi:hypothetical protein